MTGPAWLRHQAGRHRGPAAKETTLQPSLAASSPQPPSPLGAYPGVPQPAAEPPEPDRIVECGFCHVSALSSQMASLGAGQYRCARADGDDCVRRYVRWRETGAKSAPLLSSAELVAAVPAEALAPLPEPILPAAQEAALAAFNEAHDQEDAAESETLSEDDESPEAAAEPPAGTTEPAPVAAGDETPDSPAPEHTEEGDE
jgi:hypothetical protein